MKGKWVLLALVAVLIAGALGALSVLRKPAAVPVVNTGPAPLPTGTEISLSGKVEASNVIGVSSPANGVIEEYLVNVGEEVFEGQLLARVKDATLEARHEQAKERADDAQEKLNNLESQMLAARLEASRTRAEAARVTEDYNRTERIYQRQQMLNSQGATPRNAFEKAQREFETSKLEHDSTEVRSKIAADHMSETTRDIEEARKKVETLNGELENATAELATTHVHAPADGLVLARKGDVGTQVQRGEEDLVRIATDLTDLQIAVEPEPPVLARLKPGVPALVFLSELGNEPVNGAVEKIENGKAIIFFQTPQPLVKPGLSGQVRLKLP